MTPPTGRRVCRDAAPAVAEPREPVTKAGRALDALLAYRQDPPTYLPGDWYAEYRTAILAIEAEAARAAVEARDRELRAALRELNRRSGKGHGGCVQFVAVMDLLRDAD